MQKFRADVPDQTAGETAAGGDLDVTLTEITQVAQVEVDAGQQRHNSAVTKQALRRTIEGHLHHFNEVAHRTIAEVPGTELKIGFISRRVASLAFVDRARVIQANVTANKDLLVRNGMSETVLTEFGASLDQFEKAASEGVAAQQARKAAHARMVELDRKVARIARVLDTLYRTRFRDDPEMLAKWDTALIGRRTPKARGSAPETPASGTPPAPAPASAEVKPAA